MLSMPDRHNVMMPPLVCFLPSPIASATVWHQVAGMMTQGGWQTIEAPLPARPATPDQVLTGYLAAIPDARDVIVVPHSNAGLYVPLITGQRDVTGYVFVDAVLPQRTGEQDMIPPGLYEMIAGKADADGLLPPWSKWWDEDISSLFPSPQVQAEFEQDEPRVPLSYFHGQVSLPDGWDSAPGAYLAFGETYAPEFADAQARGWPTRKLAGEHLHMLVDPPGVAAEITALIAGITATR
jgi:hypothetical protein